MEPSPRKTPDIDGTSFVDEPRSIEVGADHSQLPRFVRYKKQRTQVRRVIDSWLVEEGWWTDAPVDRLYFRLALATDRVITIYHDNIARTWWEQRY